MVESRTTTKSAYSDEIIGKALSEDHATRMQEHKGIKPVVDKQQRLRAVGSANDFPEDPMATYMTRYCEEIFEPKRILDDGDWLARYREPDQRFEYYKQGKGNIQWLSPGKNKIYLFIADKNSFTREQIKQYQLYASAFFHGVAAVEVVKAGDVIPGQSPNLANQRRVPKTFLETEIDSREGYTGDTQYACCGKRGILNQLPKYRPRDSYAMQLITMKDLYPGPRWNFCFGWASYTEGVAAFSFCRYDPAWDGIDDPDREKNLLMRGCHIMCHEIGHQFGLRHCIYYECLMNGINSAEEQRNGGIRILCPVCNKKLKQNLKFDATERYEKLASACEQLGFEEEAAIYTKLIADCKKSGIKANRPAAAAGRMANALRVPQRGGSSRAQSEHQNGRATIRLTPGADRANGAPKKPIWR